ncbi:MAG: diguanylate cyclase [Pseudomonadota bacterium]|nr:diguanylate cyclase [Pseudomonadota bacterium]
MEKPAISKSRSQQALKVDKPTSNVHEHAETGRSFWPFKPLSGLYQDVFIILSWIAIWQIGRIVEYTEHASVWFPAAGYTLACFLVLGWRAVVPIMVAAIAITVWNGHNYLLPLSNVEMMWGGVLFGVAHMLPYYAGASVLGHLLRKPDVTTPQLIVSFLIIGCISSLVATQLVIGSLVLTNQMSAADIKEAMLPFWIGDMAGVVVLAPLFAGLLVKICAASKIDLLAFSNCASFDLHSYFKKVAINLTLILFVMLLAKLTQSRDSAFAIFFLAITHMWIACTESTKRNVISLAISSLCIVLLVHIFALMDYVKVYQFALNVIAANALFGIAIPQLQADNALLKDRVFVDTLTQAYTREYLAQRSALEMAQSRESGSSLYFVMFDLDKFKRINDELGHVDGDNALRRLSQVTKDIVRKADVFARFGGDEFVLLLPNISEQNALNLVDKVREGINEIVISEVSLSSSFGVTLMQQSDTLETLIQRADRALYASKEKGGNTITLK